MSKMTAGGLHKIFVAQVYGQLVTIVVQLALVPILLHAWGAASYGTWLLLSTIPAYLSMSDFGFTTVAKTMMVMRFANGDKDGTRRCFQTVFSLVCVVTIISTTACVFIYLIPNSASLSPYAFLEADNKLAFIFLVEGVVVYQSFLLVAAGIRTLGKPALESTYAATMRLAEAISVGSTALLGGGLAKAALALLIVRLTMTAGLYLWMCTKSAWLRLGVKDASWNEFKSLRAPAAAFMSIPLSQAMLMQAPILALGAVVGPIGVAAFSTARTVLRVGCSAVNMLNATFVTRYSVLAGSSQIGAFRKLFSLHTTIALSCGLVYILGALAFGKLGLSLISHGTLHVPTAAILFLAMAVGAEMVYTAVLTALSAANIHAAPSHLTLAISLIAALACLPAAKGGGTIATALTVLVAQGAIAGAVTLIARKRLHADAMNASLQRSMAQ
jgi:O-antigen/teichoic acid export membrane protein